MYITQPFLINYQGVIMAERNMINLVNPLAFKESDYPHIDIRKALEDIMQLALTNTVGEGNTIEVGTRVAYCDHENNNTVVFSAVHDFDEEDAFKLSIEYLNMVVLEENGHSLCLEAGLNNLEPIHLVAY